VHILISNAKAFLLGTFHGFGKKHLQSYLDEFCYRLTGAPGKDRFSIIWWRLAPTRME